MARQAGELLGHPQEMLVLDGLDGGVAAAAQAQAAERARSWSVRQGDMKGASIGGQQKVAGEVDLDAVSLADGECGEDGLLRVGG
jgi:hypothetical protein